MGAASPAAEFFEVHIVADGMRADRRLEHAARCRQHEAHQRARWSTAARRLGYRKFAGKVIDPDVQEAQHQTRTRRVAAPLSLMHENIQIIENLLMVPGTAM